MGFFDFGLSDVVGGALGFLGGKETSRNNARNQQNFEANLAFQKETAKNAHQWEVNDLKKAGLNPILSATGGSGAKASGGSSLPDKQNKVATAIQMKNAVSQTKLLDAQTRKTDAETATEQQRPGQIGEQTRLSKRQADRVSYEINHLSESAYNLRESGNLTARKSVQQNIQNRISKMDEQTAKNVLQQLEMEMDIYKGPSGKFIKEQEVRSRGNTAKSMTSKAGEQGINGIKFIIDLLKDKIGN